MRVVALEGNEGDRYLREPGEDVLLHNWNEDGGHEALDLLLEKDISFELGHGSRVPEPGYDRMPGLLDIDDQRAFLELRWDASGHQEVDGYPAMEAFVEGQLGDVTLYTGPMFAGKTSRLIEQLCTYEDFVVLKPETDDRHAETAVVTHDGKSIQADVVPPSDTEKILDTVYETDPDAVGIDEAQFFDEGLYDAVAELSSEGYDVVLAGLDRDYRGNGFGPVPELVSLAGEVHELTASCYRCGDAASLSQKLLDDDDTVDVGGAETYQPVCEDHHYVP